MTTPIDISTLTPFAALVILGYLVFRYLTAQAEKKDAFTENIAIKSMERADQAIVEMQIISANTVRSIQENIESMRELTQAVKDGDDKMIKKLCAVGDMQQTIAEAQIDHEDQSAKRHKELV